MPNLEIECPAKLNLYLAVTCRREDGWHELVSLVAKLNLCDTLTAEVSQNGRDAMTCNDAELSAGPDNLVLKAAAAYRKRVPDAPFMKWTLFKRIPYGAGMGGGSSDAVGALRLMNTVCNSALTPEALLETAAEIGSDCPLFLHDGPCLMRGRGEKLEPLPTASAAALTGSEIVAIKPHFGVPTGWAYSALDRMECFTPERVANDELSTWIADSSQPLPMRNSFEKPVFSKYLCYDVLNQTLQAKGLPSFRLTGSGSACFAFADGETADRMLAQVTEVFGKACFAQKVQLTD